MYLCLFFFGPSLKYSVLLGPPCKGASTPFISVYPLPCVPFSHGASPLAVTFTSLLSSSPTRTFCPFVILPSTQDLGSAQGMFVE